MKISSNIIASMTVAHMNKANNKASTAMERLSSGLKINSASDDPAGLAIAKKLNTQVKGLKQANQNVMNGISMIQAAEGALSEVHAMLNRLKELNVQSQTDALTDEDIEKIQAEVDALIEEIETTSKNTEYNKIPLLNSDNNIMLQIGANAYQEMEIDGKSIKLQQVVDILGTTKINDADMSEKIDEAIAKTSEIRGILGAAQNRLEHTTANLAVSEENMISSLSRVQDTDMAEEMTNYTQQNVISQAGMAMLAQANQRPMQVLQLLNS